MPKSKTANVFTPQVRSPGSSAPSSEDRAALIALYTQQRWGEAEQLAVSVTKRFPDHGLAWKVLGAILRQSGRTQEALVPMQKAAALSPTDYEAFNNLGVTLNALGRSEQAVACYEHALKIKKDFAEALGNMGDALRTLGRVDEAVHCYRRKLELTPDDGEAAHHISALTGCHTERAPDDYVEKVFDAYADNFDSHLLSTLQYQVPAKLVQLHGIHKPVTEHPLRVLDLGCGTGLVGAELRKERSCELVGVDLSAQMLEKARSKSIYDRLEQAELLAMMQGESDEYYDLVIAGDVFVYLGKLDDVAAEARRLLRPDGAFVFTVEHLPEAPEADGSGPYQLLQSGRYAHKDSYLHSLASNTGFKELELRHTTLRQSQDMPILGSLVYWRK